MVIIVIVIIRRNFKVMIGYKIIVGIICFLVEDGLGIFIEREREKEKKIFIISNLKSGLWR